MVQKANQTTGEIEIKAPERLWVQLLDNNLVSAFTCDPREFHDNGKPVYQYVLVDAPNIRQRAERTARRLALELTVKEFVQAALISLDWEDIPEPVSKAMEKMADIITAEFDN